MSEEIELTPEELDKFTMGGILVPVTDKNGIVINMEIDGRAFVEALKNEYRAN